MSKIQLSPLSEDTKSYSSSDDVLFKRKIMKSAKVVDDRLLSAELKLEPDALTASVMSTPAFSSFAGSKENKINYSATEPTGKYSGMLWMDTSETPKLLKRWNGSAWEATAYNQSQIDVRADSVASSVVSAYAYSKDSVDTLLAAYSTITQTATDIALNIGTVRQAQGNLIPYTQQDFEQGTISLTTGANVVSTQTLRMKNYIALFPSTDYLLEVSGTGIDTANTFIVLYTSGHVFSRYVSLSGGSVKITTSATEVEFRVRMQKSPLATFALTEMPNFKISVTQVSKYLTGAKYTFDGTKLRIDDAGLEMWYGGAKKVYFDTVNSRYVFEGEIDADSGTIGGFSIEADQLIAGSGTTRVGMSPSKLASGYYYVFWAGNDNPYIAPFRVQRNGQVSMNSATIGGWTVNSSSIYKGDIKLDATNERLYLNTSAYFYAGATTSTIYGSGNLEMSGNIRSGGTSGFYAPSGKITLARSFSASDPSIINTGLVLVFAVGGTQYLLTRDASGFVKATTVFS